jgi:hypothetical protein
MVPDRVVEVRCERCQASFAPETRRCVHCGGRLGPARALGAPPPEQAAHRARVSPPAGQEDGAAAGDEEKEPLPSSARNLVWAVTAILLIVGSMLGRC